MARSRRILVYFVMIALIAGHFFDVVTYREHWPFSNYPMFDSILSGTFTEYQIACLTRGDDGKEVPVVLRGSWMPSLPPYKLQATIRTNVTASQKDPAKLQQMLQDYLATYNSFQRTGQSGGPPAIGLRLYCLQRPLTLPPPHMSIFDTSSPYVTFIMEVRLPVVQTTGATTRKIVPRSN